MTEAPTADMADRSAPPAESLVAVPIEAWAVLLAGAAMSRDIIKRAWANTAMSPDDIIDLAEQYGLHLTRAATEEEAADPAWWGHEVGAKVGDEVVGEFAPMFRSVLEALVAPVEKVGELMTVKEQSGQEMEDNP